VALRGEQAKACTLNRPRHLAPGTRHPTPYLMRGLFITFEGIDGCGKSTQLELLAQQIRQRGFEVVVTREPGGTPLGEGIRQLLVSDVSVHIAPTTELLLYVA